MRIRPKLRALGLLLVAACGGAPAPAGGRVEETATAASAVPTHRVRVVRDGTVLAAFGGSRASAVLDGKHLSIELVSPDGGHRLAIEVDGSEPGVYPLVPTFEATKAVILLVSHGVPVRISPADGELRLTESAEGRCSGSFAGTAQDANGYRYGFDGSFSTVPVRRL